MATRAVLKLELIGDNYHQWARLVKQGKAMEPRHLKDFIDLLRYGQTRLRPWVAWLASLDVRFGFARQFVRPTIDFGDANSIGSRGIFAYYALKPGLYEVNECIDLGKSRRYFIRVTDGQITEITREEVLQCLTSTISE